MTTMTTASGRAAGPPWQRISTGDHAIAVAERPALGTSARIALWPPEQLRPACAAADEVLTALDAQASRFRADSEISWLHRRSGVVLLSDGLAEAIGVALAAARWTGGRVDPTVGQAVISLGYDRDFATIDQHRADPPAAPRPAPGWPCVQLDGSLLRRPPGVQLDLGATAKAVGADRAARAALAACRQAGGVLVSLGGDIATAGIPPQDGWPVTVSDGPDPACSPCTQLVRLPGGAVATSSVTCRRWHRGCQTLHHIVDPVTGLPAAGPWRTVTAAAATCADANAAATAAIVAGAKALQWLESAGLPARLVTASGDVRYAGGWPAHSGGVLSIPPGSRVYARPVRTGGLR